MKAVITIIVLILVVGSFVWYYQSSSPEVATPVDVGDSNAPAATEITDTDMLKQIIKNLEEEEPLDIDSAFQGAEAALSDL